ncbi:hypothetical protein BDR26DRAFT_851022 [Obelidium mucronatum]|nr:hypothetical protein BDR26DRAFT_851022 [Obelidium mucronatum]
MTSTAAVPAAIIYLPSTSNASLLDEGLQIWASVATSIRKRFQPPVSTIPGSIPSDQIIKQFINGLTFVGFLILLAIITIPLSIYLCSCGAGFRKSKKDAIQQPNNKYITMLVLFSTAFCVVVSIICGTKSNKYVTQFIVNIPPTTDAVAKDALRTTEKIPTVVSGALQALNAGLNATVDQEVSRINFPTAQLVGTNSNPGPVPQLLSALTKLMDTISWTNANIGGVDSNVTTLSSTLSKLQDDIQSINTQIAKLNSVYSSPLAGSSLTFQLKSKIQPLPAQTTADILTIQSKLQSVISAPLSVSLSTLLKSLPDLPSIYKSLSDTFPSNNNIGTKSLQSILSNPIKEIIQSKVVSDAAGSVVVQSENFAKNMSALVMDLNATVSQKVVEYQVDKWDYIRAVAFAALFGWCAFTVVGVLAATAFRSSVGMRIVLPQLAVVTFLVLVCGAAMFSLAVTIGESCNAIADPNAVFLTSLLGSFNLNNNNNNIGNSVRNFIQARETCLARSSPTGGLVEFAENIGVRSTIMNPMIQSINISSYINSFNLSVYLDSAGTSLDPVALNATLTNILSQTSKFWAPLQPPLASASTGVARILGTTYTAANPAGILSLFNVLSNPKGETFTVAMVSGFLADSVLGDSSLTLAVADVMAVNGTIKALNSSMGLFQGQFDSLQVIAPTASTLFTTVLTLVETFISNAKRNLTERVPAIKSQLYQVVSSTSRQVDSQLDCKPLMLDSVNIENSVCRDLNSAIDGLWLSFAVLGLSLFITLASYPCIVKHLVHRLVKRTSRRKDRADSHWSIASNAETNASRSKLSLADATTRRRGFGKETPRIQETAHADDILEISASILPRNSFLEEEKKKKAALVDSTQTLNQSLANVADLEQRNDFNNRGSDTRNSFVIANDVNGERRVPVTHRLVASQSHPDFIQPDSLQRQNSNFVTPPRYI